MSTMTIRDIAEKAGLKVTTVRRLHAEASRARRDGIADERTMPAPRGMRDDFSLEWEEQVVADWLAAREQPARKGAVPKSVLRQAIMELERGRKAAALRILKAAL